MSDQDQTSRTEEPTHRRLADARRRGEAPLSQDLKTWAALTAGAAAAAISLPSAATFFLRRMTSFLERPEAIEFGRNDVAARVWDLAGVFAQMCGPFLALLALVAIGVGVAQVGLLWAPEKIKPDWSKLSPLKGLGRLFSKKVFIDFAKGLAVFALVGALSVMTALAARHEILVAGEASLAWGMRSLRDVVIDVLTSAVAVMALVAAADVFYQRLEFLKRMRMTKQEVRDEHKQTEGDPLVKSRLRRLRSERARRRMMAAVPEATVVIANPTHFAVALRYEVAAMPAPKVVAKGLDALALRIRALAEAHGVPVIDNPPLARALYASVELDDEIPAEHYQAVAQVIGYVMRLDRRAGARPGEGLRR